MAEKSRSDISPQKRSLKLTPLLGDWTTYSPPRTMVKKVKIGLYGFDRLSADELNQSHILHYNFAQKFCDLLRTQFHVGSEIYQVEALQNTYSNFIKAFTFPIYEVKIKSSNFHDDIFIGFDMQLVNSLINASLGSADISRQLSELTTADETILNTFFENYMSIFYGIFNGVLESPTLEKVGYPTISENKSINPQATFVHFVIELSINNSTSKIHIGYNGSFLKNLLKIINQLEKKSALALSKLPNAVFNSVDQAITVTLGKTNLTMSEIHGLEVGDVVSFDRNIESAIPITLNEGHVILGQPGKVNDHLAVKVVAVEKEKAVKIAPPSFNEPAKEDEFSEDQLPKEDIQLEDEFGKMDDEFKTEESIDEGFPEEEKLEDDFSEEDLEGSLGDELAEETTEEKTEDEFGDNKEFSGF